MIAKILAEEFNIKQWQSEAIIKLINEKNTIPFIANYRKEVTGLITDKLLRKFFKRVIYLRNIDKMKDVVIDTIKKQNKLTEDIEDNINKTKSLLELEKIYMPYVNKEETKADIAKEKGLGSLANIIRFQKTEIPIVEIAEDYISKDNDINSIQEAISGAQDIIAGIIADQHDFKELIQKITFEEGELVTTPLGEDKNSIYEMYYNHSEPLIDISNHRVLAINRGEEEGFLKVEIIAPEEDIIEYLNRHFLVDSSDDYSENYNEITREYMEEAILRAYHQLIAPSIQEEIRNYLTLRAEEKSLELFSNNLENLLMLGPIKDKLVLGWNPSIYTSSKLVVVDDVGEVIANDEIFLFGSQEKLDESKNKVLKLIHEFNVEVVALGDSTDSKRFEEIIVDVIKDTNVKYALVNQAGASVYSESNLAEIEFPDFDKGYRNAISLARRLQDPLVELVKVDPKSIGVGQYQHDLNQDILNEALRDVVERVVNDIGVNLNSASICLLSYVAGLNLELATNIINYREENGVFTSLSELLKVKGIDSDVFKQCAGFLKVYTSNNPLEYTKIHPESYKVAETLLEKFKFSLKDIGSQKLSFKNLKQDLEEIISLDNGTNENNNNNDNVLIQNYAYIENLVEELKISKITLRDIISYLEYPFKDPRDDMPKPLLKDSMLSIEDLKVGMELEGSVKNVVDFGVFIDIGVHYDGLVHISKMNQGKFVNHPSDLVNIGDIVNVKIIGLNLGKNKIELTINKF